MALRIVWIIPIMEGVQMKNKIIFFSFAAALVIIMILITRNKLLIDSLPNAEENTSTQLRYKISCATQRVA